MILTVVWRYAQRRGICWSSTDSEMKAWCFRKYFILLILCWNSQVKFRPPAHSVIKIFWENYDILVLSLGRSLNSIMYSKWLIIGQCLNSKRQTKQTSHMGKIVTASYVFVLEIYHQAHSKSNSISWTPLGLYPCYPSIWYFEKVNKLVSNGRLLWLMSTWRTCCSIFRFYIINLWMNQCCTLSKYYNIRQFWFM